MTDINLTCELLKDQQSLRSDLEDEVGSLRNTISDKSSNEFIISPIHAKKAKREYFNNSSNFNESV
jgi:hypothetical protein